MIIKCPNCGQSLPDTFTTCQFCGADVTLAPRVASPTMADAGPSVIIHKERLPEPEWPRKAYVAVLVFWMLSAIGGLAMDFTRRPSAGPMSYHGLLLLVGLLLLFRVDFVERFIQYVCWFLILFGGVQAITFAQLSGWAGNPALLLAVLSFIGTLAAAFMLYLVESQGVLDDM